jgi:hypothetical protein
LPLEQYHKIEKRRKERKRRKFLWENSPYISFLIVLGVIAS